ncbi:ferredoxin family protein [Paenibacillus sp. 2TAF8]|jgi:ferredoxin|uniref:4Fe-4S dicluster domain-containing protein n=1 Tax=Paenibacillus sp. 2TAF8 TaxID=3233020 RepID=UPI003F9878EE
MSWVITATCEGEVLAKCIVACPEEAIQTSPGAKQYYINPSVCTDCGLCDLACPVAAIFPESAVPKQWRSSIEENRSFFLT